MLRQKPANEKAIEKLIDFLNEVQNTLATENVKYNFTEIIENHGVAKRSFSDLKALNIVKNETGKKPEWIASRQPLRITALQILDYRLKKSKKTIHVPIPDFAAIGESLKTIAERLAHIAVQNERWLKTHKNPEISNEPANLFKVEDQRLYIAGQIASAMYYGLSSPGNPTSYYLANNSVINATDDLMAKLLNKQNDGN